LQQLVEQQQERLVQQSKYKEAEAAVAAIRKPGTGNASTGARCSTISARSSQKRPGSPRT